MADESGERVGSAADELAELRREGRIGRAERTDGCAQRRVVGEEAFEIGAALLIGADQSQRVDQLLDGGVLVVGFCGEGRRGGGYGDDKRETECAHGPLLLRK